MTPEQQNIMLEVLQKQIYEARLMAGDEHYSYLVRSTDEIKELLQFAAERINNLAKEFYEYRDKGVKHKYETFGGRVN